MADDIKSKTKEIIASFNNDVVIEGSNMCLEVITSEELMKKVNVATISHNQIVETSISSEEIVSGSTSIDEIFNQGSK